MPSTIFHKNRHLSGLEINQSIKIRVIKRQAITKKIFLLLLVLSLFISGCGPGIAFSPIDVSALRTQIVQTIVAIVHQTDPTSKPADTQTNAIPSPIPVLPTDTPTSTLIPVLPTDTQLALPTAALPQTASGVVHIRFVNVGQGDSTVIQAPDGKITLIDGGDPNTGIVQYLQIQGINRIDLMVATQPARRSHRGTRPGIQAFLVTKVFYGGEIYTTKTPVPCYNNIRNEPGKRRCWEVRFYFSQGMVGFWDGLVIL
ncbi:MAG: hypothetical protein WCK35_04490 [Chloroflexota bacterium]